MKNVVAIMQPYVFPYIGYFCLVEASDIFVFYDDVNFITRGWINRNRILINGNPYKFTIPLSNSSQNELIYNVKTHYFPEFRIRFLKQIQAAYGRAPNFKNGFDYVHAVLNTDSSSISDIAINSIKEFYRFAGLAKNFLLSSECFADSQEIGKTERLISITKALHSENYINSIGGTSLYEKSFFHERGIELSFIRPCLREYKQIGSQEFRPGLSIIDAVMNNDIDEVVCMIKDYEIL